MDTAKKILLFSVGIILTVGFIAIGMNIYNKARASISNSTSQYDTIMGQLSDLEYSFYEGDRRTASGSELAKLIKNMKAGTAVIYVKNGEYTVVNGSSGVGVKYEYGANDCGLSGNTMTFESAVKNMEDKSKALFYINPSASFSCLVTRDSNGSVSTLTFTQN